MARRDRTKEMLANRTAVTPDTPPPIHPERLDERGMRRQTLYLPPGRVRVHPRDVPRPPLLAAEALSRCARPLLQEHRRQGLGRTRKRCEKADTQGVGQRATIRVSPQRRAQLVRLSDALGCAFIDTIEQGLDALEAKLRGSRGSADLLAAADGERVPVQV